MSVVSGTEPGDNYRVEITMIVFRVEIGVSTRRDVEGRLFAQIRTPDGGRGPHMHGDRPEVDAWIGRLREQCAAREGYSVEVVEES
jgi:hypothetical protein